MDKREPFLPLYNKNPKDFFKDVKTPAYVISEEKLEENGKILKDVEEKSGCKILLAQKAFSNYDFYPLLSKYVSGTEASGLYEARLGFTKMKGKEVHTFSGAYKEEDIFDIIKYSDHIIFNSVNQLRKFGFKAKEKGKEIGLRINPECSTQEGHEIYDPCAKGSRLGVTREEFLKNMTPDLIDILDGIHFHTLCEQNSHDLLKTVKEVDKNFKDILLKVKWVNMGGGHHITKGDYDIKTLLDVIKFAKENWHTDVYLEPGEAVALNAGFFITKVLDIVTNNGIKIAILDGSAACHMPDVIEMPYLPPLYNAREEKDDIYKYHYRLGGPTCLSGDIIGDYYFKSELKEGDILVFGDMAIYTTCKNNTFNGMPLPSIINWNKENKFITLCDFTYKDFEMRLGK